MIHLKEKEDMKNMHRIFSMLLVLMMIVALVAVPVHAEETANTYTITIAGTASGHTFEAYQIFSGVLDSSNALTEVDWGTGVDTTKTVDDLTLLQALNQVSRYAEAKSASDVATLLNNASTEVALEFAEIVNKYLSTTKADTGTQIGPTYEISGLTTGYYLIKDQDGSLEEKENESYTEFILSLSKNTTVNPKSGHPTVAKKVSETGVSGTYGDWVTQSIGSKVHFDIRGTVSNEIHYYDTYFYQFNDTMTSGLTFDEGTVSVTKVDANGRTDVIDPACYTVVAQKDATTKETSLTITFNDLLSATSGGEKLTINRSDIILVHYTATLNEDSLIGLDNPDENEVYIVYSNNPNTNDHGKTNKVDVDVYTFELDILKVDAMDHSKTLANAEFILYRTISNVTTYAKATKNGDGIYKISEWVASRDEATTFVTDENGELKVSGLKAGAFYVEETKAPAGYNKLSDPMEVWIQVQSAAVRSTDPDAEKVTASVGNAAVTVNAGTGVVTATVENAAGTMLPSTGGIGTTIFYALGGIMVFAAVILLITKKRMGNNG